MVTDDKTAGSAPPAAARSPRTLDRAVGEIGG
jgi:hypothetical protein